MNSIRHWQPKKSLLLLLSCGLVLSGSAQLIYQFRSVFPEWLIPLPKTEAEISVELSPNYKSNLHGAFPVDSVDRYVIQRNGRDAFSLLVARYQDGDKQSHNAILFPENPEEKALLPSPTALRHGIWQAAAQAISKNITGNALVLSWWDDGQRVHFLSGRNAWLRKPSTETFNSSLWKNLHNSLLLAANQEHQNLVQMAKWLAMDSRQALGEIRSHFGTSQPIYLLVTNDLLMRLKELADYGGKTLAFNSTTVPVRENLHSDIGQIKRLAAERGDGNYLVQKEGAYYHVWSLPKHASTEKDSLLVRMLPFVDSLKKLPEGVHLVYQSNWGGYLSVYKLD